MSIPWGPALDAEVAYRHQQARNDFRPWNWRRKSAKSHTGEAEAQHVPAPHIPAPHNPAQHDPAQRVAARLVPIRPRPIEGPALSERSTQPADTNAGQERSPAHAA